MASKKTLLYYGSLLHDVGKVVYRAGYPEEASCSELGHEFICRKIAALNSCFAGENGRMIAEQIRYHNCADLAEAVGLSDDSLAYVTCFANAVAAGMDCGDEDVYGESTSTVKLRKIFNVINGHRDENVVENRGYESIRESLTDGLSHLEISSVEVNTLLGLLESSIGSIPASTNKMGLIDVSLYDHVKATAGIAACVYEFLREHGTTNYRKALFGDSQASVIPMFLLYSCDMSGIQDFIYNISGDGALKQLRARSMYLELLLEHIVDELLERLGLNRTNLLYAGGGHAYLLLPNTAETESALLQFGDELTTWFVDQYRNDLYVASAWTPCSADDLSNRGEDKTRYPAIYQRLSRELSEAKASRYDAATLRSLNFDDEGAFDHGRECSECHRSDLRLDEDNRCTLCAALGRISKSLVDKDVFVVEHYDSKDGYSRSDTLALPFDCRLRMIAHEGYQSRRREVRRIYVKNDVAAVKDATRIWMGDYTADTQGEGIAAYAEQGITLLPGKGVPRLGVLRADIDDLGATFVSGLPSDKVSITRTATLSRALSRFFKSEINSILQEGRYQVQIIYSGGDDLFIVGNWCDVMYASVDIRKAFDTFTGNGSLTLSAGLGMFDSTYPIARMAAETGLLEDKAKMHPSDGRSKVKNAICLWAPVYVFDWDEFIEIVVPRMNEVREMFESNSKGSALIYRLIALLRSYDPLASAPHLAYLLARSFEDDQKRGGEICKQLYAWAQDKKERLCLVTALEWYVYSMRERSAK